jgi:N-acetylmuramoyl-L-alanine amidase
MAKVFLSAGHGGSDPGACANGLQEKVINLNTLLACKSELERHGVTVVASRTNDANDPVQDEVREANASGADIAVSFHANAGGGDGFEAFYWASSAEGKRLAQLGEKYVKQLGQNSRGCKNGNHLMFVNGTSMVAVLFESFFLDNSADKAIGDTVAEQSAFGVAYAKAILEYFGIAYKAQEAAKPAAASGKLYRVQVGAFSVKENAEKLADELKAKGYSVIIKAE